MMEIDLEMDKVIEKIKKEQSKTVCIQLPDGLKPKAEKIQKEIEKNTEAEVMIWMGSCFGACDVPEVEADLLIQWGHTQWKY